MIASPSNSLTRLRELSRELDDEECDLSSFFDASLDLLAVIRFDGSFHRMNRSWNKSLGWTNEELDEKSWIDLVHPDDEETMREVIERLRYENLPRFCCRMQTKNRRFVVVEFSASRWQNGCSHLVGRVVPDSCLSCQETGPRFTRRAHGGNCTKDDA